MATEPSPLPAEPLPAAIEEAAAEILLGPPAVIDAHFEQLCAAHEPHREPLQRFRADYERAAAMLNESPAPPPAHLPTAIGPYQFRRQIGSGAFGVVFLAEQQQPIRRQVAIKLLHSTATSPTTISRFLNERETLARMSHPAIARIFDAGVDAVGRPYFVMEYVPGEPLHHFVTTRAASLNARIELFLAACDGVNHAHQRGVIHRDLKPQNVLVAEVDGRWQPKVIDFGLAKVLEADAQNAVETCDGAVLGTPAYMSPEQVRGDARDADTRTDVYALGVMLYELLAGVLPIDAERYRTLSITELQRLVLLVEPPLASNRAAQAGTAYARSLRGDLDWVLQKAMAKNADERYASVADFAADLRRFLGHEPVTAGPPSTSYLLRKFVRRHRGPVVATLLVMLSLLLGMLVSTKLYQDADRNAARARANLEDFWRLADVVELEQLVTSARELWPSAPSRLDEHLRWMDRATDLLGRQPQHERTVASLQVSLAGGTTMSADEQRGARFLLERLQSHVGSLRAFAAPGGTHHDMQRRSEFARTVQQRTIDERRPDWQRSIDNIKRSPRYHGLQLSPVLGLVPLGSDPDSGLEEFAHLRSGSVPTRGADGKLSIQDDTAIILVLLPGGDVELGSQSSNPTGRHYDPSRQVVEADYGSKPSEPFFIGKYELTQAQVQALGVELCAYSRVGSPTIEARPYTARHPEESVVGPTLCEWLPHFELRLPDTNEWEIAARAGSGSIWGVADRVEDLQGHANVADAALGRSSEAAQKCDDRVDDGHLSHAPVGSFRPNAFGLYDMIGNVAELTTASTELGSVLFLARGGSYTLPPIECRIGSLRLARPNQTTPELGVRVARSLPRD